MFAWRIWGCFIHLGLIAMATSRAIQHTKRNVDQFSVDDDMRHMGNYNPRYDLLEQLEFQGCRAISWVNAQFKRVLIDGAWVMWWIEIEPRLCSVQFLIILGLYHIYMAPRCNMSPMYFSPKIPWHRDVRFLEHSPSKPHRSTPSQINTIASTNHDIFLLPRPSGKLQANNIYIFFATLLCWTQLWH